MATEPSDITSILKYPIAHELDFEGRIVHIYLDTFSFNEFSLTSALEISLPPNYKKVEIHKLFDEDVMIGISNKLKALEGRCAPAGIYYQNFALLCAFAQLPIPNVKLTPLYISDYLTTQPEVPGYGRLNPRDVTHYFETLREVGLIIGSTEDGYKMPVQTARILAHNLTALKTSELDEVVIKGIVDFAKKKTG